MAAIMKGITDQFAIDMFPTKCFYCGKDIGDNFVGWSGATDNISLHKNCAKILSVNIAFDATDITTKLRMRNSMTPAVASEADSQQDSEREQDSQDKKN